MRKTLLLAFLILLSPISFSKILTNQPGLGGTLNILVEGAGNQNATLTSPDGTIVQVPLVDGQAHYVLLQSGRWEVKVGAERVVVRVSEPVPGEAASPPESPAGWVGVLAAGVLVLLAVAAAAIWTLAFPPGGARGACLEKFANGNRVTVRLRAGATDLEHVRLVDEAGVDWSGKPMKLNARRLKAGHSLRMNYEYAGAPGAALAEFIQNGKSERLECVRGKVCAHDMDGRGKPEEGMGWTEPKTPLSKKKLARI